MLQQQGGDYRLRVSCPHLDMSDVALGDSIATNGVCLTVVSFADDYYEADVSVETINNTGFADYRVGQAVNLEALQAHGRLGGHIVSGHVDGVGTIVNVSTNARAWEVWVEAPANLAKYIAHKGSITVDGVSLTVNKVDGARFMLTRFYTMQETIIGGYQAGTKVNLEVDVIARYLERLLLGDKAADSQHQDISMEFFSTRLPRHRT